MKKGIIRPKRKPSDIVRFIENLPNGLIRSGKASDLVGEDLRDEINTPNLNPDLKPEYIVDKLLGLNNKEI